MEDVPFRAPNLTTAGAKSELTAWGSHCSGTLHGYLGDTAPAMSWLISPIITFQGKPNTKGRISGDKNMS